MAFNRRKNGLTEDDINFIVANTDLKRDTIIDCYNVFKNNCPSGKLDKPAFVYFYKQLIRGDHADEQKFCSFVFNVFDTDGNGFIEFGEFMIGFWIRSRANMKDKLSWLFDVYDCDKSGSITMGELEEMLRLVFNMKGITLNPYEQADGIMQMLDRSQDGRISRQEFIAGCSSNPKIRNIFSPF
jgi:Ca2+-binding EF-hand superfamily protein